MTDEEIVKQKYPEARVSLNQYAYSDAFGDIPYEIVVCGPIVKEGDHYLYLGPIHLATDCATHQQAWSAAAYRIEKDLDVDAGPYRMISKKEMA